MFNCLIIFLYYCRSVKIILEAEQKVEIVLILCYVVSNASWTPAYDVRVFTEDKTMKVEIIINLTFQTKDTTHHIPNTYVACHSAFVAC